MKNKLKRVTIATLSACMIANAVPIPGECSKGSGDAGDDRFYR